MRLKNYAALGLAIVAPFSLSGCLLLPGAFTSEMTLMKSGDFTFSYNGQIQLVGLANLLNNDLEGENALNEFTPTCYGEPPVTEDKKKLEKKKKSLEKAKAESAATEASIAKITVSEVGTAASRTSEEDPELSADNSAGPKAEQTDPAVVVPPTASKAVASAEDDGFEERECSAEEIAEQKKTWDEDQERRKKEKEQSKKMFASLLGGVDPEDPKTIARFTKEVERLASWNKVEHLGDGVFKVDYTTKGRLADDFAFPVIPRYALGNPMVHVTRWDNGRVRIEAPTFHNDSELSLASIMGTGSLLGGFSGRGKNKFEPLEIKGSFVIKTDAPLLANNSEEGPVAEGVLQVLRWDIGPKTYGPPMALIKLAN
jgi:hypothetical protein